MFHKFRYPLQVIFEKFQWIYHVSSEQQPYLIDINERGYGELKFKLQ